MLRRRLSSALPLWLGDLHCAIPAWGASKQAEQTLGGAVGPFSVPLRDGVLLAVAGSTRSYGHMTLDLQNKGLKKGPGGRSSVSGLTATVFGATGFLGRYVVNNLAKLGSQVVIPYRCDELEMMHLKQMGDLGQIVLLPKFDISDRQQLLEAVCRSNIVINMVGAQQETWNYSFRDVHVEIAKRIADATTKAPHLERFIHVSAMGANAAAPSQRLRSKAEGDEVVKQIAPHATLIKPAYMIGCEDRFYNHIASLGKSLPFVPLIDGGNTRVQPVFVRDVADAMMQALKDRGTIGKTYTLAGPEVMTMKEATELVFYLMRERFYALPYPSVLAKASVLFHTMFHRSLPLHFFNYMLTADFVDELAVDNVLSKEELSFKELGMKPRDTTRGISVDHIRYYRSGGYDHGTIAGQQDVPARFMH